MKPSYLDLIDFYDFDALEKLQETRARKWLRLQLRMRRGDQKAKKELQKLTAEDEEIKTRARKAGFYWV